MHLKKYLLIYWLAGWLADGIFTRGDFSDVLALLPVYAVDLFARQRPVVAGLVVGFGWALQLADFVFAPVWFAAVLVEQQRPPMTRLMLVSANFDWDFGAAFAAVAAATH